MTEINKFFVFILFEECIKHIIISKKFFCLNSKYFRLILLKSLFFLILFKTICLLLFLYFSRILLEFIELKI